MERIEGRTAFVTGGASGMGLAMADSLVGAGARVVIADWDPSSLEQAAARLRGAALPYRLDVTDRAGWHDAKRAAEDAFGPVEILINNAGIGPDGSELADMAPDNFDLLVSIKLTGTFNGIHTFAAGMRARGEGHIVNTASMAGLMAGPRLGAYTASKFAVVGMSEVLRAEMAPHGVGVSVLCPGLVRTNLAVNNPTTGPPPGDSPAMEGGIDPAIVGAQVLDAIRADDMYVITHGEYWPVVAARAARLQEAFDSAPTRAASSDDLPGAPPSP